MAMNMEDEELVKMVNPTLKRREAILFFLIVVINELKMYCLRYWARYVRKGEVKSGGIKIGNESASWILLLNSPSETPYLTINYVTTAHQINIQQLIL